MADIVNTGATANDGSGDQLRAAFQQINQRFQQLLGTLSQIEWAPGLAIEATPARQWTIQSGQAYVAASNHIAGATFAADLAAGKWLAVDAAQSVADLAELALDLASTASGKGAEMVAFKQSGAGAVDRTASEKLREFVSAKDFGAVGDGVTDDTAAVVAATAAGVPVYFPSGTYNISNVTLGSNVSWIGDGRQKTIINVTATAPAFGIKLAGQYISISRLAIQGAGRNLMQTSGASYRTEFNEVFFGPCAVGLQVSHDFFWARFTRVIWRECTKGLINTTSQDMNACQFIACQTFNNSPTAGNFAIEITGADGVSFVACDIQNQGVYLNGCKDASIHGGYWEAYSQPALKLTNSTKTDIRGMHAPSATVFEIDAASAASMDGDGIPSNKFYGLRPTLHQPFNIFPDPTCSTSSAVAAFSYTATGTNFTRIINGSGHLELTSTNINARSGFGIPIASLGKGMSVYVKWRATAGSVKVQLLNTAESSQVISTAGDDWLITRLASKSTGSTPYLYFSTEGAGPTWTAEIDDIFVAPSGGMYADPEQGVLSPSALVETQLGYSARTGGLVGTMTASTGTVNVSVPRFTGFMIVKNMMRTNADNQFTSSLFFIQKTGSANFSATSVATNNGPAGGCAFTVTNLDFSNLQITNTHTAETTMVYQLLGCNQ